MFKTHAMAKVIIKLIVKIRLEKIFTKHSIKM